MANNIQTVYQVVRNPKDETFALIISGHFSLITWEFPDNTLAEVLANYPEEKCRIILGLFVPGIAHFLASEFVMISSLVAGNIKFLDKVDELNDILARIGKEIGGLARQHQPT